MKPGARQAIGTRQLILAGLLSALLASCSSTADPTLELASPSYSDAGAPNLAIAEAEGTAGGEVGEGDVSLPQEVAAAPAAKPSEEPAATAAEAPAAATPLIAGLGAEAPEKKGEASVPVPGGGDFLDNGGPILTAGEMPAAPIEPKKKSFLSSFFGSTPAQAAPEKPARQKPLVAMDKQTESKPAKPVRTASLDSDDDSDGDFALPGVRTTNLFEIKRKSGLDDVSDIDVHEDENGAPIVLASAAGLARLAPNGLLRQRESVDVACLKPALVRVLKKVERHFGKKMVVTSGYRSPSYNRKVNGAKKSQHMYCAAADVQMPGVSKWELAKFVRTMPGRGGVGTYCHTESVHIDIGPERDWNWKCRRRS